MKFLQAVLVFAVAFIPALASAQPWADPTGIVVKIDDKTADANKKYVYINKQLCTKSPTAKVTFDLNNAKFKTKPLVVEVWRGQGTTDCASGSNRQSNGGTASTSTCKKVAVEDIAHVVNPKFTTDVNALFRDYDDATNKDNCGVDPGQNYWIYILSLQASTPEGQGSTPPTVGVGDYKRVNFFVDYTPPGAPTDISTSSGETEVGVDWTTPSDLEGDVYATYNIYYDDANISDSMSAECTSSTLMAGKAAPSGGKAVKGVSVEGKKVSPSELGLTATNTKVPVAVTAIDQAGNESVLSDVQCVAKVETSGFWDSCTGDCRKDFDQCSAAPWKKASGMLSAVGLMACSAVLMRRRRRNV